MRSLELMRSRRRPLVATANLEKLLDGAGSLYEIMSPKVKLSFDRLRMLSFDRLPGPLPACPGRTVQGAGRMLSFSK